MNPPQVPETLGTTVGLRTRWSDEDNQSVLNNAVYLTLFEEGRLAYFTELGLMDGRRFPFLLAQTNVRFVKAGHGGAEVSLEMGTLELGRSSFVQAYRLRGPDGEVWAEAEALLVCYDPQTGRSRPMAPEFRAAIADRDGL
jgi:acyl-CoA thioester hydrolase